MSAWERLVHLRAPSGGLERVLFMVAGYAGLVGIGLLLLIPVLFLGCGRDLCGFFG